MLGSESGSPSKWQLERYWSIETGEINISGFNWNKCKLQSSTNGFCPFSMLHLFWGIMMNIKCVCFANARTPAAVMLPRRCCFINSAHKSNPSLFLQSGENKMSEEKRVTEERTSSVCLFYPIPWIVQEIIELLNGP